MIELTIGGDFLGEVWGEYYNLRVCVIKREVFTYIHI